MIGSILSIVVALLAGNCGYYLSTRTTEEEVDSKIQRSLPMGSTSDEIFQFLELNDIEHTNVVGYGQCPYGEFPVFGERGPSEICAVIKGTEKSLLLGALSDIYIYFVLDEDLHLIRDQVQSAARGTWP